jgi:hypothetical protein
MSVPGYPSDVLYGAAAPRWSDRWKKGCTAPLLGTITVQPCKTDQKEDAVGRKSDRPTHKRESAFEKLQSERDEKGLEEDLERDEEEREERKREREKARGQEESS